ncbi:MAG: hypothetical protein AAF974_12700 [Cyanobacteria bacterium P01_E01_bin.34]
MQATFAGVHRYIANRWVIGGAGIGAVALLHVYSLLIPLIRFGLLAGIVIAVVAIGVTLSRVLMPMIGKDEKPAPFDSSQLKVTGIACGIAILCFSVALLLLPSDTTSSTPNTNRGESSNVPGGNLTSEEQLAQDVSDFFGALGRAQAEQQNDPRYQRFQDSINRASVCPRCGGQGNYRYVDQSGVLQVQQCPSCLGSGRSF